MKFLLKSINSCLQTSLSASLKQFQHLKPGSRPLFLKVHTFVIFDANFRLQRVQQIMGRKDTLARVDPSAIATGFLHLKCRWGFVWPPAQRDALIQSHLWISRCSELRT